MNKSGRGGLIFIRIPILLLVLSIILASSLYLFIKSPYFIQFLEYAIGSSTGSEVSIGAVHLRKGPVVVIRDLVIKRAGSDEPFILLPDTEIKAGFSSLIRKRIERVDLRGPKIFFRLSDDSIPRGDGHGFSLPFSLISASIENGEAVLQDREGASFRISAVHLLLNERGKEESELKGTLFLDEIGSTVPVEMVINTKTITVEEGAVEITLKELDKLPYKELNFFSDKILRGELKLEIGIYRKEAPGLRLFGRFKDISIQGELPAALIKDATGEVEILLSAGKGYEVFNIEGTGSISGHIMDIESKEKFSLKGSYRLQTDVLLIEEAVLESSLFGSHVIRGSVRSVRKEPEADLSVEGEDIPLDKSISALSGTASELLGPVEINGRGRLASSIKGKPGSPSIKGVLHLQGKGIKGDDFEIGPFEAQLPFQYEDGIFIIKEPETKNDAAVQAGGLHLKADSIVVKRNGHTFYTEEGISLSASLTTIPEGAITRVTGKAKLHVTKGAISSPDGYMACEELDMKVRAGFIFDLPLTGAVFTLDSESTGFELLAGRFYGSFKDKTLSVSLKGSYSGTEDSLTVSKAKLDLTDIGTILLSGNITELTGTPNFSTDINLTKLNNKKAFNFLFRETFQESLTLLSDMDVGGTTSIKLSLKGTAAKFDADGEFSTVNVDILKKDSGFSLKGLNISLPFDISYPEALQSKEAGRFGSLSIGEISWGAVRIKDLVALPAVSRNSVMFKEDITIPVFEGQIRLQDIRSDNILGPDKNFLLSIQMDRIDLDEVTRAFDIPVFSGNLSGSIPKAGITGNSLMTEGEIVLELFGGKIMAKDLSVNNIFSSVPSLQTSISIEGIDLGELTSTFDFGHISGEVRGYVKDLVVSNGQAESFKSSIETVHRKDIDQWISVEALEKISVLGGSSTSVLNTGLYRFFRKYRYEKIGFKGLLRNDNFIIKGVKAKGRGHYLVVGGALPPKVDVINYTQNVSFQEMLERLKRIKQIE